MTLKSILVGGLAMLGVAAAIPATVTPAEAKTRVHVGVGLGFGDDPFWNDCENPGFIDYCGAGFYHHRVWPGYYPYYRPYYRHRYPTYYDNYDDRYTNSCAAAARAIRGKGYSNVRAVDCRGRHFSFRATKRGKAYVFNVDTATGRISRAR